MGENLIISVIICTKNRPLDFSITLDSICKQNYLPYYIIVVDDSDDMETRQIIDEFSDIIYYHPRVPSSGLSAARNAGLEYVPTNTELVLFLDDDVTLDPNYLEELKNTFESHPEISGAGGQLKDWYHNSSPLKKIIYAAIGFVLPPLVPVSINKCHITKITGVGTMPLFIDKDPSSVEWLSGCNMAYRYCIFENSKNKFDENLIEYGIGEDALFSHGLWLEGHRFAISRKSLIEHRISKENRMPPFKKMVMIFSYRRYLIQNFTKNKMLSSAYYYWFAATFITSTFILCLIGKYDWGYLKSSVISHWYVVSEPDIRNINKFIKGEL